MSKFIWVILCALQSISALGLEAVTLSIPTSELLPLHNGWHIKALNMTKDSQGNWREISTRVVELTEMSTIPSIEGGKTIAVYEIELDIEENRGQLMLWLPNPLGAITVFANHKVIFQDGHTNDDGTKIRRGDAFVPLPPEKNIKLRIEADNSGYAVRGSGFYMTPLIGSYQNVLAKHNSHVYRDMFLLGLIFITTIYHLLLYLLRRKNRSTLIFAIYTACVGVRMLFASDGRILLNHPIMHPLFTYVLENALGAFGTAIIAYFPMFVLKPEKLGKFTFGYKSSLYLSIYGLIAALVCLVPIPQITDMGMNLMQSHILLVIIFVVPWVIIAVRKRQPQSIIILFAYLTPCITGILDISFYFAGIDIQTIPFGMSLFICFQAGMLSIRFNSLFDQVDDLNDNLEQKVEDKTRDIRSTLDNIPQGVFRIVAKDHSIVIDDEFSKSLTEILDAQDLAGADPFNSIFKHCNLDPVDLANLKTVIKGSIGEDFLQFECNAHLLPKEFSIHKKTIEVDWAPILDDKDELAKLLCILKDVTSVRELHRKAIQEAENAVVITEIARVGSFKKVDEFLISAQGYIDGAMESIHRKEVVFRNLHTLKGLALTFNFQAISNLTHEAESFVQSINSNELTPFRDQLEEKVTLIEQSILDYRNTLNLLFEQDAGTVSVSKADLESVKDLVNAGNLPHAVQKIIFLYENNVAKILDVEIKSIKNLAERLRKAEPEIIIENDYYILDENTTNTIKKSFIHLLRNSIDHGIEPPFERVKTGKSEHGHITISVNSCDDRLIIRYQDDGRGLNLKALRKKAQEYGIKKELTPAELGELIFNSGLSTAESVTDISGRGVGMEAVKKFIEIEGGKVCIVIESIIDDRAIFAIQVELPYQVPKNQVLPLIS